MQGLLLALSLLSTYNKVVWENTKIDIPLGSSIYDYVDIPDAILFIDGIEKKDQGKYFEKEVDRTSFSVVNTNHVKEYHVNYQVVFPNYGIKHTMVITFNIVDTIKPTVISIPNLKYPLQTKTIDYLLGLEYYDNYYKVEDIKVNVIGKEQVKTSVVGFYPIIYQIIDGSNNMLEVQGVVEIYDDIAPTMTLKKEIILNPNESFLYSKFIEIKDNYDVILDVVIMDDLVSYHKIGVYSLLISATDKQGNTTRETFTIKIIDSIPPEIVLVSTIPEIEVHDQSALMNIKQYCLSVRDNYADEEQIKIEILHDININTVGTYEIIFKASDPLLNESISKMKIKVVDTTKPTINVIKDLVVEVHQEKPNFLFFFQFSDNYSSEDDLKIVINEKINMNKIGRYELLISVTDENKNKKESLFFVEVIDNIPPVVSLDKDIIITDFNKKEYKNYLTITDNLDKTFIIEVDDSLIDYQKVGIYELILTVKDQSLNETILLAEVIVCDIEPPSISLSQQIIYLDVFSKKIDYSSYILKIEDNYDELSLDDVIYDGNINYDIVGKYQITFLVFDSSGNYQEETLIIYIDDYTPPVINVFLPKETNTPLSLYDYVTVFDNYDGNITDSIMIDQTNIDYSKKAIYHIKYFCLDSRGNYQEEIVELSIILNKYDGMVEALVPYLVVFSCLTAVIVIIYLKKTKKRM
ncbi:hypothetical protein LJC17_02460 [Acholeplasma sp. OttesenSCG-928-E16]|nr:hypothetical protein [Acholeplasma sp. OttesenSCG-928-E16]